MSNAFVLGEFVQWALLIILAFTVILMRRQGAVLSTEENRVRPGGTVSNIMVHTLEGTLEPLLGNAPKKRIILFFWPGCASCEATYPYVAGDFYDAIAGHPEVELTVVTVGESPDFVRGRFSKWEFPFRTVFVTPGMQGQLPVRTAPYGMALDEKNTVRAATVLGPVSTFETLLATVGIQRSETAASARSVQ